MAAVIKKDTLGFLKDLKRNNDRDWFNANKDRYQSARENLLQFVQALVAEMVGFDKSLTGLDPAKTIFRIYRDTRFAHDKAPFKTNLGAYLIDKKRGFNQAGYYLHLEPGECFLAGGIHMPDAATLKAIRKEISGDAGAFLKMVNHKKFRDNFTIFGEQLSRIPQGFDKNDPMGEYLRYKELSLLHGVTDKQVTSEDFLPYCAGIFKLMVPFNTFINDALMQE